MVTDTNLDVDKMEKMLNLQIKMMDKQAEIEFNEALSQLQQEMPRIGKTGENKHLKSKYMKYEDIDVAIRPILAKFGFSISYNNPHNSDGKMVFSATLKHKKGHSETTNLTLGIDKLSGSKSPTHETGSTISYARRYCVCMLLNIVAEGDDDDAQKTAQRYDCINSEQIEEIKDLLERTQTPLDRFLTLCKVTKISEIPVTSYQSIVNSLNKKLASI